MDVRKYVVDKINEAISTDQNSKSIWESLTDDQREAEIQNVMTYVNYIEWLDENFQNIMVALETALWR